MHYNKIFRNQPGKSILVFSDVHVKPGEKEHHYDRIPALGNLILDLRPDYVICGGDLADFDSLSSYKKKAADAFSGAEAKSDVMAFRGALKALKSPTDIYNQNQRTGRKYQPKWIFLEGNHEERWRRFPETELLGHDHLQRIAQEIGWEWMPFLHIAEIEGILFSHYFESGVGRRPAGINTILKNTHRSCVFGHSHLWDHRVETVTGGGTLHALCTGCYKPPHRCGPHEWSGVTLLTDVQNGSFCINQIPYDAIQRGYGIQSLAAE